MMPPDNSALDSVPASGEAAKRSGRRFPDWTVLVLVLGSGVTVAWIGLLSWAVLRALGTVLG